MTKAYQGKIKKKSKKGDLKPSEADYPWIIKRTTLSMLNEK